jgi:hypothetical protein
VELTPTPYALYSASGPNVSIPLVLSGSQPGSHIIQGQNSSIAALSSGVVGEATGASGFTFGLWGESDSPDGTGIYGLHAASTGTQPGIRGVTDSNSDGAIGVSGMAAGDSGATHGVLGESSSDVGTGVRGLAKASSGQNFGVYGQSISDGGTGVFGAAIANSGTTYGVYGLNNSPNGTGVYGWATAESGITRGVYGRSSSLEGIGVYGLADRDTLINTGVWGETRGNSGWGVVGNATHKKGTTVGVWGRVYSGSAVAGVYGQANASTGFAPGVYGMSSGINGVGVRGEATNNDPQSTGYRYGGHFTATSVRGIGCYGEAPIVGVYGKATFETGTNYGVYGEGTGPSGEGIRGNGDYRGVFGISYGEMGRGVEGSSSGDNSYGGMFVADGFAGRGVEARGDVDGYDFYANGPGDDYGSSSSIRWKSHIRVIDDPLGKVLHLRGVYFNWDAEHGGQHDVGMIAEEVGEVLPEIVQYEEDGIYTTGMDYSKLTPLLVEAVKALKKEVDELQRHNEEKDSMIETLKDQNKMIKQRLASVETVVSNMELPWKGEVE